MEPEELQEKLNDFINLEQVKEIITLTTKEKVIFEIEYDKSGIVGFKTNDDMNSTERCIRCIILSVNVEKKQGYTGYRKVYILND